LAAGAFAKSELAGVEAACFDSAVTPAESPADVCFEPPHPSTADPHNAKTKGSALVERANSRFSLETMTDTFFALEQDREPGRNPRREGMRRGWRAPQEIQEEGASSGLGTVRAGEKALFRNGPRIPRGALDPSAAAPGQ
jgi:hypothetical protein